MPLYQIKKTGKNGKLGIWHITESLSELIKIKSIYKPDLPVFNAFSHEGRKKEWLAVRILIEHLTKKKNTQIIYDANRKPFLKNSEQHISFSHSHGLVAAIIDDAHTGIDVELIKPKIQRIKNKFMSAGELNSLPALDSDEQLTVFWSAKEALYKLYGKKELGFQKNLIVESFSYAEKGVIKGSVTHNKTNTSYWLQYEKLNTGNDKYILAYIINQD